MKFCNSNLTRNIFNFYMRHFFFGLVYKNCDVMSWGSHSRLLERAIVNVQALGDRKNPSVLWLNYKLNINKTGIFAIHFYFLYFFNDDHGTFSKVE